MMLFRSIAPLFSIVVVVPADCGFKSPSSRIVGGQKADPNEWEWQAMLRTKSGFQFCGGSLVSPNYVLTAAHCVKGAKASSISIRYNICHVIYNYGICRCKILQSSREGFDYVQILLMIKNNISTIGSNNFI